jgi:Carboxypeptidase regulatory-like domain
LKLTTTEGAKESESMEVGAMTGTDGTFDFPNVAPGGYWIATGSQAFAPSFVMTSPGEIPTPVKTGAAPLIGRAMVEVGEQDLDNVVLALSEGAVVSGAVRMDREDPDKPSPWPGLTLVPVDGQGEESIVAQVKPDGSFRIPHIPPDGYSLQVTGLPDDVYVKSIRFEGREIGAEDLNLTSGAGGQLDIVLSPNAAAISGVVRDAQGDTAAGATVQVCSGDDTVKYLSADANGEYKVGGLPPGDYRVLAWEEVDPGLSFDAAFRAHFEPQIASVTLGERAHSTVEVKMIGREAIESEAAKLK